MMTFDSSSGCNQHVEPLALTANNSLVVGSMRVAILRVFDYIDMSLARI